MLKQLHEELDWDEWWNRVPATGRLGATTAQRSDANCAVWSEKEVSD